MQAVWFSFFLSLLYTAQSYCGAAEQRGVQIEANDRVVLAGISEGAVTAQSPSGSRMLQFGDVVNAGELIETDNRATAEVLIGNRAVVTLGQGTMAQLTTVNPEQGTIQVPRGIVRIAASAAALGEFGTMTIQTPTSEVKTHGGIIQIQVNAASGSMAQTQAEEAKPYLASYSPHKMVAALDTRGEIIQVEEGSAQIASAGSGGESFTVTSGQSVMLQAGQAGSIAELDLEDMMRTAVLASTHHSTTPQEGLDNLVALQVDQATALGQALTGAAKTGQDQSGQEDTSENVINGATGGVQVAANNTSNSGIISTLFGGGNASNPGTPNPTESTGGGFSAQKSNGTFADLGSNTATVKVNGGENARLVFTKKEPVQPHFNGNPCGMGCFLDLRDNGNLDDLEYIGLPSVASEFTVDRELVLVGGTPNDFHGGIVPTERLIVRGPPLRSGETEVSNVDIDARVNPNPFGDFIGQFPSEILDANSTFVFRNGEISPGNSTRGNQDFPPEANPLTGGILGQFANDSTGPPNTKAIVDTNGNGVTGAITGTGSNVMLIGGVTLDRGTVATIGTTTATNNYFMSLGGSDAKFDGSLLSVINGPSGPTALTVQDRLLGVYDGSMIKTEGGNKALLSVLDAKLTGPTGVPLIDINAGFKDADTAEGMGSDPEVTVTSAVVTRSTTIPLDGALLEASAPLLALTHAEMTTTSHFADLAGSQNPSIQLGDALVALNASKLTIANGHLLNLNNATANVNGFLFSLNDASTLAINNGTLFSLNNGSSLNLNASALGVFGSGNNTLSITNNLCAASCGTLVNSANTPFVVNGSALQVSGVTQDVVLPNNVNVFAGNPASTVNISADAALFHVDDTSTLTINGTAVVN